MWLSGQEISISGSHRLAVYGGGRQLPSTRQEEEGEQEVMIRQPRIGGFKCLKRTKCQTESSISSKERRKQ